MVNYDPGFEEEGHAYLDEDDIEPFSQAIDFYLKKRSSIVVYKGHFWDWRMAVNALEELKSLHRYDQL